MVDSELTIDLLHPILTARSHLSLDQPCFFF